MADYKKILCVDFDGTLTEYKNGWQGIDVIDERPVPGAMQFIVEASKVFEVHIFGSRSAKPEGIEAMKTWLHRELLNYSSDGYHPYLDLKFPTSKPPAFVSLDDRTIQFNGIFPKVSDLLSFKPWNK